MSGIWVWLGSSNSRPYKAQFENEKRKFELCTKAEHFEEQIATLKDKYDYATIAGLDNILADYTKAEWDDAKLLNKIDKMFKTLEEQRQEGVRIMIEPLIPWKKHSYEIRRSGIDVLKNMKKKYPGIRFAPRPSSLRFAKDGVHLDERSGRKMFKTTYAASEEFFLQPEDEEMSDHEAGEEDNNILLSSGEEIEIIGAKLGKKRKKSDWSKEVDIAKGMADDQKHSIHSLSFKKLVEDVKKLKEDMDDRWELDLIVHAGTKEDLDKIENNQNMNKVVISGLEVPEIWDQDNWKGRVAHIKDAIADLFKFVDPDHDYVLGYVKHLNQSLHAARQIVEVTLDSERHGRGIRKCLANKIKQWKEKRQFPERMNGVSISPSLTVATRVRVAMLKAIAKAVRAELPETDSWVIQHAARPVLKVEITLEDKRKAESSYGFAQSIAFMIKEMPNRKLSNQDFFEAYQVAGMRFGPEMSHYFVLLNYSTAMKMQKDRMRKVQSKKKILKPGLPGTSGVKHSGKQPQQNKGKPPKERGASQEKTSQKCD